MRCTATTIFTALLILLVFSLPLHAEENEPKYKNPSPSFKPLSIEEEKRLAPIKLGKPPELSEKENRKIEKGKIVIRKKQSEGKAKRFEAIAIIKAPPAKIMSFLSDFDSFVGVMPNMKKISYKWDKNLAVVEQWLKIAFSTIWYKLNIQHYQNSVIEWEYVHGDIKDTKGYYKMFPQNDGKETLLIYHVYTDPGIPVPQFVLNLLTRTAMPGVIKAIRKEVVSKTN